MERRHLGHSGLQVPVVGLGTAGWDRTLPLESAGEVITRMLDNGSDLVDVTSLGAEHHAEHLLGELLRTSVLGREELMISLSSGYHPEAPTGRRVDCSRRALLRQLDASLRRLHTDHVDLWSIAYWDPATPIAELSATMDMVLASGRVRYVSVHGYQGWQLALLAATRAEPLPCATEYSLLRHTADEGLLPAADYLGSGFIATRPLALGVLGALPEAHTVTAHHPEAHAYDSEYARTVVEAVDTAARGLGTTPASTALAWVIDRPGVTSAVVGMRSAHHVAEAIAASQRRLPRQIRAALDDVSHAAGRLNVRE